MAVSRAATVMGPNGIKRLVRVPAAPETPAAFRRELAEAQALRDGFARLAATARSYEQRSQALIAGLLADHRRRHAVGGYAPRGDARVAGALLRRARDLAEVSQRELAAEHGYSRGAIAAYEDPDLHRRLPAELARWAIRVLREHHEWPDDEDATEETG